MRKKSYRTVMALEAIAHENHGQRRRTRDRAPILRICGPSDGIMTVHVQDVDGEHITRITPNELIRRKASDDLVRDEELGRALEYLVERGAIRGDSAAIDMLKKGAHRE